MTQNTLNLFYEKTTDFIHECIINHLQYVA